MIVHAIRFSSAEEKYKREVIVIPVDFSEGKPPKGSNGIYSGIAERLGDLDIGILGKLVIYNYALCLLIDDLFI